MIDKLSWIAVYPEITLLVMACAIAMLDLAVKSPQRTATYLLTLLTLATVAVMQYMYADADQTIYGFGNMVVSDSMGNWLKLFATLAMMVTLVYGRPYAASRDMLRGGEMFTLSLFSLLGMFVMISGNNFVVLYLGLELLTLSGYALVALRRDHVVATEAAMKYFVLGAMASGFLLYGLSMLYGATGSLDVSEVFQAINSKQVKPEVLVFGLVFIIAGLGFKLGVVPFHMWVPDVYQGAPTAVTLIIGGAPKLAAFAIVVRLLVEGLMPLSIHWQQMLMVLAVASLLVGNLAAIMQTNLKRMLAFSTISQMGFVLLGMVAGNVDGDVRFATSAYGASMFYVTTYVLTTLASFGIIMLLSRAGFESEEISDLAGLNQRSPLYAGVMSICMLSLAGIPPLVGFFAKLTVLQALIKTGLTGHLWLAGFAVMMSLIGAFYYIRVIKVMYFDKPSSMAALEAPQDARVVLAMNGLLILVLGLFSGGLISVCQHAIAKMLTT